MMKRMFAVIVGMLLLAGCVAPQPSEPVDPFGSMRRSDGSVLWQQEYAFVPPEAPWQLIDLNETDYSIAFMKTCRASYPCQSTLAYAEEPFGYSMDFEQRQREFFKRFLWASRVNFAEAELSRTEVFGEDALIARTEGIEPVQRHKVDVKVVFARRGERVVAFYYTQWRPEDGAYDKTDIKDFDRFVENFSFERPSFYQRLLAD
ncbi:MAG: hypothetical protein AB7F20_07845 [Geoalkalibacter sp.]|uniref:hypothetical protein n=1 Tax=Geoalkalibacter sp. TaxID=3041440 RepID=UPI003D103509